MGRRALAEGITAGSPSAETFVAELLDDGRPAGPGRRQALADRLTTFTDARVECCWALLGVLNGRPRWEPSTPAVQWWIEALRAG